MNDYLPFPHWDWKRPNRKNLCNANSEQQYYWVASSPDGQQVDCNRRTRKSVIQNWLLEYAKYDNLLNTPLKSTLPCFKPSIIILETVSYLNLRMNYASLRIVI